MRVKHGLFTELHGVVNRLHAQILLIVCQSWLWADLGLPSVHVCVCVCVCLSCPE